MFQERKLSVEFGRVSPQPGDALSGRRSWGSWFIAIFFGILATSPVTALAQPKAELEKRQGAEYRLESFGPDLMGDGIDPHTGTIQFSQTDISLPGNFPLEVAIRRKRSQGSFFQPGTAREFGDWQMDVPRIHVVGSATTSWTGNRCSTPFSTAFPNVTFNGNLFQRTRYTTGVIMEAAGGPGQQVMDTPSGAQWPAGTTHVTVDGWRMNCISASDGGQGFLAWSPTGDQYRFDRFVSVDHEAIGADSPTGPYLPRKRHMLLATRVTDVNGNTVDYTYDSLDRLTRIEASDGRRIDLAYTGSSRLISSVTASPGTSEARTWTYTYGTTYTDLDQGGTNTPLPNSLISVTLPNTRAWSFDIAGMQANPGQGYICPQVPQTITMTHPYGTVGVFKIAEIRSRQSLSEQDQIVNTCPNEDIGGGDPSFNPYRLRMARIMAVREKRLTGPNLPEMVWTYQYENDNGPVNTSASDPTNWTKVVDPEGHETTYYHNWTRQPLGGKLDRKEVRSAPGGTLLETTQFAYVQEASIGSPVTAFAHAQTSFLPTHESSRSIEREGSTSTTTLTYEINHSSANYSFGAPLTIVRGSSLGGTRTEVLTYSHNKTEWVIRLPLTSTINGRLYDSYSYDTNGRVSQHNRFGALLHTYTYHTATGSKGAIATVTDALSQVSQFNNWKRGTPQQVVRPDSTTISRVVDNNGWVTSQTDARGFTTGFQYNAVGWLTAIDLPSVWADATLTYTGLGTANAYSTATVGTQETVVWYDAFLRPYRVRTRPVSGGGATTHVKTSYDGLGRTVFTSLPSTAADPTSGMVTAYDALGRVLTVTDNTTGGVTSTAYLTNGRTQVTDPKGQVTTTHQRYYGSPDTAEVTQIDQPLGLTSTFTYDTHGNLTALNQAGTHSGYSSNVTRNFWYDGRNRLCRHRAPELGDELFAYDALDRLTQKASGLSPATGCATPPAAERTTTSYDAMGRPVTIDFPGATPDITKTYDNNGNLTSVSRDGTVWTYQYNSLDKLSLERLQIDGRTYEFSYGYTTSGFLAFATMPWTGTVSFSPNGIGQSTGLSMGGTVLASGGTYFPNGELSALSLGNGHAFSATQNSRQLIASTQTVSGSANALKRVYGYDAVLPRLTSITDQVVPGENRSFSYDALGRLSTASGPWGSGSFTYDLLGNVRQQVLGARTIDINYNASNRVSQYRDSAAGSSWQTVSHDGRGNVTALGALGFAYDHANQPVSVSGSAAATYVYDGNLKRVKSVEGGAATYSVYSSLTGKISVIDNQTAGDRITLLSLGPVSVRVPASGAVQYTHLDHLGSPVVATSSAGGILWRESYTPFGEKRNDPTANRNKPGYTGHVDDAATGLTYMQARYYSPVIGRFLSTDPIGYQDQLNLYAYVHNDPVNQVDLTGLCSTGSRISGNDSAGCKVAFEKNERNSSLQKIKRAVREILSTADDFNEYSKGEINDLVNVSSRALLSSFERMYSANNRLNRDFSKRPFGAPVYKKGGLGRLFSSEKFGHPTPDIGYGSLGASLGMMSGTNAPSSTVLWVNAPAVGDRDFILYHLDNYAVAAGRSFAGTPHWNGGRPILAIVDSAIYYFPKRRLSAGGSND